MDKQLEWTMHLDKSYYMNVFGDRIPVAFTHGKGMYLYSTEESAIWICSAVSPSTV